MNNLRLFNGAGDFDLPKDLSYNYVRKSPIFTRDLVIGDYSNEFNLPFTVKNDTFFNFFRHNQASSRLSKIYCEQYVDTNLQSKGYLLPLSTEDGYRVSYSSNLQEVFGIYRSMPLNQIDFGTITIPSSLTSTLANTWTTGGFVFPTISSPQYYQNPVSGYNGKFNDYNEGYLASPVVPMFFVRKVLALITTLTGYTFGIDFSDMDTWIIYNTFDVDGQASCLIQNHLPDLNLGEFVIELAKMTNSALFFDVIAKKITFKKRTTIFTGETTLNWSNKVGKFYKVPVYTSGIQVSFALDTDDATTKLNNAIFDYYLTANSDENIEKIDLKFSTLIVDNGFAHTLQNGITTDQPDKSFGAKLLIWAVASGSPKALPTYGDYDFSLLNSGNGLIAKYYALEEQFWKKTHRVERIPLSLNSVDLSSWSPEKKVYINGINYLFDEITCPLHDLSQPCIASGYALL
jgi:hypothetical protein